MSETPFFDTVPWLGYILLYSTPHFFVNRPSSPAPRSACPSFWRKVLQPEAIRSYLVNPSGNIWRHLATNHHRISSHLPWGRNHEPPTYYKISLVRSIEHTEIPTLVGFTCPTFWFFHVFSTIFWLMSLPKHPCPAMPWRQLRRGAGFCGGRSWGEGGSGAGREGGSGAEGRGLGAGSWTNWSNDMWILSAVSL